MLSGQLAEDSYVHTRRTCRYAPAPLGLVEGKGRGQWWSNREFCTGTLDTGIEQSLCHHILFYSYLTPIRFLSITVIRLIGPMKDPQLHKTKNETAPVLGINNALSIRQAPNPAQERTPSVV